jgi:hypothetical protein
MPNVAVIFEAKGAPKLNAQSPSERWHGDYRGVPNA